MSEDEKTVSQIFLDIQEQMCDKYCKYSNNGLDADELYKICEDCPLGRLV